MTHATEITCAVPQQDEFLHVRTLSEIVNWVVTSCSMCMQDFWIATSWLLFFIIKGDVFIIIGVVVFSSVITMMVCMWCVGWSGVGEWGHSLCCWWWCRQTGLLLSWGVYLLWFVGAQLEIGSWWFHWTWNVDKKIALEITFKNICDVYNNTTRQPLSYPATL